MKIPITKAIFDEAEKNTIIKPLETGWVVQGPYVAEFEKLFAEHTKVSHARAMSNCTTALHVGLIAMGIKEGDKVVIPSFTYVASANAVEYTGATVVFCDIDLRTFNMDIEQLKKLLQSDPAIKAIMPVHLFGLCADMPAIKQLASEYQVKIIEDAACAFDSWINDQHAGTFGDCGCFSFHPRKAITTGEGGMLITNNEKLDLMASQLRDHGASKSDLQRHKEAGGSLLPDFTMRGYNYRMTDIQGALGVCQMLKAQRIMQGRRHIAARYDVALQSINALLTPLVPENYIHGYQSYVCLFVGDENLQHLTVEKIDRLNVQRNLFMEKLESKGIATRQGTHAVHTLSYYKQRYQLKDADFLMAYAADRLSITLPLYADMTDQEFEYVTNTIHEALTQCVESVA
jgi:dTDP-4-amino-4,6-dideoxygalactose transaminase